MRFVTFVKSNAKALLTLRIKSPLRSAEGIGLKEGGLFVLEHGKKNNFEAHPKFVERRAYGSVNFSFFEL